MLQKSSKWITYKNDESKGQIITSVEDFDSLPFEQKASWYRPFCSDDDINRVLNIKNADDFLLRLAADDISDNVRQLRSYIYYRKNYAGEWSLARHLHSECFNFYKKALSTNDADIISHISSGFAFTPDPNGYAALSEYGPIVLLSNVLKYFSSFSSLALLDFGIDIPLDIRMNAMRIAIRVFFKTESLDFEMDPRGIIPADIQEQLDDIYFLQTVFLAGHEYGHYFLGHLKDDRKQECLFLKSGQIYGYNVDQQEELDADIDALTRPKFDDDTYSRYYDSVLIFFASLLVFDAVNEYANPACGYQDHPSARDRYLNILQNAPRPINYIEDTFKNNRINAADAFSRIMIKDFSSDADQYETYGSTYLDNPNTKWRGPELIDRKDY